MFINLIVLTIMECFLFRLILFAFCSGTNVTNNYSQTYSTHFVISDIITNSFNVTIESNLNHRANLMNVNNSLDYNESEAKRVCRIFFQDQPKIRDYYLNEFLLAYLKNVSLVNQTNSTTLKISHNSMIENMINNQNDSILDENSLEENNKCENMIEKVARFKRFLNNYHKHFKVKISDFEFIKPIGKGALGKV